MSSSKDNTKAIATKKTSDDIDVEVVEEQDDLEIMAKEGNNLPLIRQQIRETLEKVDPVQARIWDELAGIVDTNELILLNLKQAQAHLQQAQRDFYQRREKTDAILQSIIDKGEEFIGEYMNERDRLHAELKSDREHIQKLMSSITQMAKEYRQCGQQKKFTVHITQVLQWKMAIEASIHRNVRDQRILGNIAEDIIDAGRALFPMNVGEDI